MARKKFRPQRSRYEPTSERSFYEHLANSDHQTLDRIDLLNIIRGGEDSYIELKVRLTNTEKIAAEIVGLANSGGGAIIFGVNDNRRVEGLDDPEMVEEELRTICRTQMFPAVHPYIDKVAFDNGRRIIVLEIADRRAPHYTADHRYFIREGATIREAKGDEVAQMFTRLRPSGFESVPLFESSIDDIDESSVWSYIRELHGELFNSKGNYPTAAVLKDMQLAIDYADRVVPNVGGLLLFGRRAAIEKHFSRSRLQAIRVSGETSTQPVIEKVEYKGNLATLFEQAMAFVDRYADLWEKSPPRRLPRGEEPIAGRANYPRALIVEAITNALVHRDYCARDQAIRLFVFDNHIEVFNPCVTAGLPRKGIELYGTVSVSNPRLKAIFKSAAYGLNTVTGGLPMMRRLGVRAAQREPKIAILPEEFKIDILGG